MNEKWIIESASWAGLGLIFLFLAVVAVVAIFLGVKRLFFACIWLAVGLAIVAVGDSRTE